METLSPRQPASTTLTFANVIVTSANYGLFRRLEPDPKSSLKLFSSHSRSVYLRCDMNDILLGTCVGVLATVLFCSVAPAAEPTKSIHECGQEYGAREKALRKEGFSAASFFHECWWHSHPGQLTEMPPQPAEPQNDRPIPAKAEEPIPSPPQNGDKQRREVRAPAKIVKRVAASSSPKAGRKSGIRLARAALRRERMRLEALARIESIRRSRIASKDDTRARFRSADLEAGTTRRRKFAMSRYAEPRELLPAPATGEAPRRAAIRRASYVIPSNAVDGRRAWIGADTATGPTKVDAVVLGPLQTDAKHGTALHCWDQNVLFLDHQARWSVSLVCDGKTQVGGQKIWFEKYNSAQRAEGRAG